MPGAEPRFDGQCRSRNRLLHRHPDSHPTPSPAANRPAAAAPTHSAQWPLAPMPPATSLTTQRQLSTSPQPVPSMLQDLGPAPMPPGVAERAADARLSAPAGGAVPGGSRHCAHAAPTFQPRSRCFGPADTGIKSSAELRIGPDAAGTIPHGPTPTDADAGTVATAQSGRAHHAPPLRRPEAMRKISGRKLAWPDAGTMLARSREMLSQPAVIEQVASLTGALILTLPTASSGSKP